MYESIIVIILSVMGHQNFQEQLNEHLQNGWEPVRDAQVQIECANRYSKHIEEDQCRYMIPLAKIN